jgi:DNA-binding transcriptional MerR regulator
MDAPTKLDNTSQQEFTIRQAAQTFGVTPRTLRFYEEKGLILPKREGQERLYSRRDLARLRYIRMGKSVGFSLDEIRELLALYEPVNRAPAQLDSTLKKVRTRIERLEAQKNDLENAIAELAHAGRMIAGMLANRRGMAGTHSV